VNFFESQAQARSHSRRLVALFLLAVVLIVAAIDVVVLVALGITGQHAANGFDLSTLLAQSPAATVTATLVTLGIIVGATLYKTAKLRSGGGVVARGLGATLIPSQTTDPRYRRLRNVVEEIAIASGVPVPEIYVLEQEPGVNAFAAGYTPADAAITVTRGCMEKLSRDEMQGVIAHEFSHIANGDMRLSIRLMGVVFGILVISIVARTVLRGTRVSSSRKGGAGVIVLAAVAIMLIGYIGVFFGRLIKASFSRQRESLADASAVQFTRQTQGLAGALKKIAGLDAGSKLQIADGEEVSHMLFGDGTGYSRLFATHPPLVERIKQLEPGFDPRQLEALAGRWNDSSYVPEDSGASAPIAAFAAAARVAAPTHLSAQIAQPGAAHFHFAESVRAGLAPALKAMARDPAHARSLILALLLDPEPALRARQLSAIEKPLGTESSRAIAAVYPQIAGLDAALRLPLAEIAFPALRQRPRAELLQLVTAISVLSNTDGHVSMFEFCMGRMIRTLVADAMNPARVAVAGGLKLSSCEIDVTHLLCAVAQGGNANEDAARRAFTVGRSHALPQSNARYLPGNNWPAVLDPALRTLDRLRAPGKELLLEALVKTVSHDGRITASEAELLRVVCASLHCPLPPLLGSTPAA